MYIKLTFLSIHVRHKKEMCCPECKHAIEILVHVRSEWDLFKKSPRRQELPSINKLEGYYYDVADAGGCMNVEPNIYPDEIKSDDTSTA